MNKEEYAVKLREMGFNAALESGVIMITVTNEKDTRKVNKAVKEIGYNASWGISIERNIENHL